MNRYRAFTLIETIITTALFAALMVAITQLYVVYGQTISLQNSSLGIAHGASNIAGAVRTAGLQARQVVAAHSFSGVAFASGTTTALFELPAVDETGAILPLVYDYVGIYASGTSVYRVVDAAPGSARASETKRLTDMLGALSFQYDDASFPAVTSVTVDATTSAVTQKGVVHLHAHELVYLRNL